MCEVCRRGFGEISELSKGWRNGDMKKKDRSQVG
jgi:hypothetical protein